MGTCACGDEYDEHEEGGRACLVERCGCIHYEAAEEDDDDAG